MGDDRTLVGDHQDGQPPSGHGHLHFHDSDVRQPIPFLFPTGGKFSSSDPSLPNTLEWSSRSSRKNRSPAKHHHVAPHPSHPAGKVASIEARIQSSPFKPHLEADCSFWVAVVFTMGSAVWVVNGFLVFLPLLQPAIPLFANGAGALAFCGGTLFEIGSYLMLAEAMNTGHEEMFQGPLSHYLRWRTSSASLDDVEKSSSKPAENSNTSGSKFVWWGPLCWRDLGYLASFIQLIAASVFWVSTITGLPGVIPNLFENPPVAITDIFFWTPQVMGGFGFVVSSLLLMIETQKKWWVPNILSVGWHVGFWNLVGAVGFLLCGAFGYLSLDVTWENYQSACSTFWGSWAFLIGSVIQLYETLWREGPE